MQQLICKISLGDFLCKQGMSLSRAIRSASNSDGIQKRQSSLYIPKSKAESHGSCHPRPVECGIETSNIPPKLSGMILQIIVIHFYLFMPSSQDLLLKLRQCSTKSVGSLYCCNWGNVSLFKVSCSIKKWQVVRDVKAFKIEWYFSCRDIRKMLLGTVVQ